MKLELVQERKTSCNMLNTKFERLSSLVLVDTLAALPMEHVVRMAVFGHENMRHACFLKWVKERMTHVTFKALVGAYHTGGDLATVFCTEKVVKWLKGRVAFYDTEFEDTEYIDACLNIVEKVTGKLHLHSEGVAISLAHFRSCKSMENYEKFTNSLINDTNLTHVSSILAPGMSYLPAFIPLSSENVFEYSYQPDELSHKIYYRPALLNGRHVIDVLRAVCGQADVIEAELNRVRREATEMAEDMDQGQHSAVDLRGCLVLLLVWRSNHT